MNEQNDIQPDDKLVWFQIEDGTVEDYQTLQRCFESLPDHYQVVLTSEKMEFLSVDEIKSQFEELWGKDE